MTVRVCVDCVQLRPDNAKYQFVQAGGLSALACVLRTEHAPLQQWALCIVSQFTDTRTRIIHPSFVGTRCFPMTHICAVNRAAEYREQLLRFGVVRLMVALLSKGGEVAQNAALNLANITDKGAPVSSLCFRAGLAAHGSTLTSLTFGPWRNRSAVSDGGLRLRWVDSAGAITADSVARGGAIRLRGARQLCGHRYAFSL